MMVVTETREAARPVLTRVDHGVPASSKIAVWTGLFAFSAAVWTIAIVTGVGILS